MARYTPAHLAARDRGGADSGSPGDDARGPRPRRRRSSSPAAGGGRRRWWPLGLVGLVLAVGGAGAVLYASGAGGHLGGNRRPASGNVAEKESTPRSVGKISGVDNGPAGVTAAWVRAENAKPGSAGWRLTNPADHHEIEGYANTTSIDSGQPVTLFISTTAPSFHVEAYRMGFYHALGGRLVWQSAPSSGGAQPGPVFMPGVNMIETHWQPSLTVPTVGWPEGDYLFKLIASSGRQQYVPLTVRNDASTAAYVVINAVTSWQAYNDYGGYDLYQGKDGSFERRSRVVSFDRPYQLGHGGGDFLGLEFPFVNFAEARGLDVTYLTDVDLHERPGALLGHRAVLSMGHDEYYSLAMREGVQSARDHGVNLAFLGANAIYRHIRFAPSPLGPDRHEIDYKSAAEDPLYGKDNADVTVNWRDPPNNQPESEIIGDFYQCNPVSADMVVVDPSNWLFAGTGTFAGQRLPKVIGSEYDRYVPMPVGPHNVEILTHSPVVCHGKSDYSDATYYSAASGAGVFASGTIDFVGNIDPICQPADCGGRVLGRVLENLLVGFGSAPAGLVHPSLPTNATTVLPAGPGGIGTSTSPGSGSRSGSGGSGSGGSGSGGSGGGSRRTGGSRLPGRPSVPSTG